MAKQAGRSSVKIVRHHCKQFSLLLHKLHNGKKALNLPMMLNLAIEHCLFLQLRAPVLHSLVSTLVPTVQYTVSKVSDIENKKRDAD